MPTGSVNAKPEAILPLRVRGPSGLVRDVEALIDTGYSGVIVLPGPLVTLLGLPKRRSVDVRLGDGTVRRFDVFAAELEWDGQWQTVAVSAIGHRAIIGMELLVGHSVRLDVAPGGVVEIVPIP